MYDVQHWINENVTLISLMTMLKTFLYIIHFIRVFPIIILLRIIACKFQYFPSIFLYFNQYQLKLFIDRLCMFPELNDLLHKQQNFSIFITDVKVMFHLKICVN